MAEWTRRRLIVATSGLATLACSGAGFSEGPDPRPEPAGNPPGPAPAPVAHTGDWEGGTLFRPLKTGSKRPLSAGEYAVTPAWFREAPALFCPSPRSGGSVLLTFTNQGAYALSNRIQHFRELPKLLEEAQAMGTSVLYLIDWFEGEGGAKPKDYVWNKGDYVPRQDMGGAEALKAGIAAVQAKGGRVLSYLELFVIGKQSETGKAHGQAWSLLTKDGYPEDPYPRDWKLCPHVKGFQRYMVRVARRLVGEYGFDGLHLDSYGYQRGWKCVGDHGHKRGQGAVFNEGCVALTAMVREAVLQEKPSAVLMCEGPQLGQMFRHVSASQDWSVGALMERFAWDQAGYTSIFSAHWSLDDLHQILALGHKLALGGGFWTEAPPQPDPARWLREALPKSLPDKKDKRFRRFFAETYCRTLHSWRNAAIIAGLPVPNIDVATPRRWDRNPAFESFSAFKSFMDEVKDASEELAAAVQGLSRPKSPTSYLQGLCNTRAKLQPLIDGASLTVLDTHEDSAAAYRFKGPGGGAVTAVNTGNEELSLTLPVKGAREVTDLASGDTVKVVGGTLRLTVPAHRVRMLATG